MREVQLTLFDDNPEYDAFLDKFEEKKTTDDCYTPVNVFEAVAGWACGEYGLDRAAIVRPFWPDGDYETFDYPEGCVVLDNPPFSLRARIINFYRREGIRFFLFSPALTLLTRWADVTHIAVGVTITYENGAEVPTSFVTNLEPGVILRTAPDLFLAVKAANDANVKAAEPLPVFVYPDEVITAAIAQRWTRYRVDWKLRAEDAIFIRALDAQRAEGKNIYGGGYLLCGEAAETRAAAERLAAIERERERERERRAGGSRTERRRGVLEDLRGRAAADRRAGGRP